MRSYLIALFIRYFDLLISIAGGLFACYYGYRSKFADMNYTKVQQRTKKAFRICGPLILLIAIVRYDQPTVYHWQRYQTNDGVVSTELPAAPQTEQKSENINGNIIPITSLTYNEPIKKIFITLSYNPVTPGMMQLDGEKFALLKEQYIQQGYSIIHESPISIGNASGYGLELRRDDENARIWIRMVNASGRLYRVSIVSTGAYHDDAMISHCLDSFRIEQIGSQPNAHDNTPI